MTKQPDRVRCDDRSYPPLSEALVIRSNLLAANPGHYGVSRNLAAVAQTARQLIVDHLREEIAATCRRHVEQSPQGVDKVAGAMMLFRL